MEMRNLMKDGAIEIRLQRAPTYVQPFLSDTADENIILVYEELVGSCGVTTAELVLQDADFFAVIRITFP